MPVEKRINVVKDVIVKKVNPVKETKTVDIVEPNIEYRIEPEYFDVEEIEYYPVISYKDKPKDIETLIRRKTGQAHEERPLTKEEQEEEGLYRPEGDWYAQGSLLGRPVHMGKKAVENPVSEELYKLVSAEQRNQ